MKKLLFPILTVLMLSSTAFGVDGNGGGANGPDLKGKAIPVALDREILVSDLSAKIEQCNLNFMRGLFRQAFGVKLPDTNVYVESHNFDSSGIDPRWYYGSLSSLVVQKVMDSKTLDELFYRKISLEYTKDLTSSRLLVQQSIFGSTSLVSQDQSFFYPSLTYKSVAADTSYDDWGNVIEEKKVARNIRLMNGGQGIVKLKNERTGRDVAFQLDFRPYETCLIQSVQ